VKGGKRRRPERQREAAAWEAEGGGGARAAQERINASLMPYLRCLGVTGQTTFTIVKICCFAVAAKRER
jgi:hypothetical protein